jgi:vancomycin resistance protein VanJ
VASDDKPPVRTARRRLAVALPLVTAAVTGLFLFTADEWVIPTLFLFGPRWVVALPLVIVAPLAVVSRSWWAVGFTILAAVLVAGPLTGGNLGVGPLLAPDRPAVARLRVVTWNMGGVKAGLAFRQFIEDTDPDLLVLQEADHQMDAGSFRPGWQITPSGGLRVASRYPVRPIDALDYRDFEASAAIGRYVVATPEGELTLVNVHLPTVRPGVEAALGSKLRNLGPLRDVIRQRADASAKVRGWVGEPHADLLLAGDFNMPVESRIYRADWGGFSNAFSEAGTGWGTTKQTHWFGVRIDHVLYSLPWRCRHVEVGPDLGSDHRPLIADLVREGP